MTYNIALSYGAMLLTYITAQPRTPPPRRRHITPRFSMPLLITIPLTSILPAFRLKYFIFLPFLMIRAAAVYAPCLTSRYFHITPLLRHG